MKIKLIIPLFLSLTLFSCNDEFHISGNVNMDDFTLSKDRLDMQNFFTWSGDAVTIEVTVTHTTSWTFTDVPSWLTITPSQGTGEGTTRITLSATQNPSTEGIRTCVFYLKATDSNINISIPITVNQFRSSANSSTNSVNTTNLSSLCPDSNHPHQIDMGTGVYWACCNVGASSPEEYGGYYAWGETSTKYYYAWSTYKWCNGTDDSMTKYTVGSRDRTVDNKTELELSDDAARVNWGSLWRIPTYDELGLLNNCTWVWTTVNDINGYKVTASNGNSIFLPAAGYCNETGLNYLGSMGHYWSSSLCTGLGSSLSAGAYCFYEGGSHKTAWLLDRCGGHSIRPVKVMEPR